MSGYYRYAKAYRVFNADAATLILSGYYRDWMRDRDSTLDEATQVLGGYYGNGAIAAAYASSFSYPKYGWLLKGPDDL